VKSKKKILVIQPNFNAISEVWLDRMTEMLQDHIIAIYAFNPSVNHWNNKIPVFDISKPKISIYQRLYFKIFGKFEKSPKEILNAQLKKRLDNSDILFIHFAHTAVEFREVILKSTKPVFIHVHGMDIFWDLKVGSTKTTNYHSENYVENIKAIANKVVFISNSRFSIQKLNEIGIPNDKIVLKYFGVPIHPQKEKTKSHHVKILYLGRLVDFKGPDLVIKAFEIARNSGMEAKLIIAGDGPLRLTCELLKFHSIYKNDIEIVGAVSVEQAYALYEDSDIFTMHNIKGPLTNQEEAFGVSIIEAMSFGLPVVTAGSGAINETVQHNLTGIIVEPFDLRAHAKALQDLSSCPELRSKMGIQAIDIIKANFSPENEMASLKKIFDL